MNQIRIRFVLHDFRPADDDMHIIFRDKSKIAQILPDAVYVRAADNSQPEIL